MREAVLTLKGEDLTFSAGHFTIFSATKREKLHGHTYVLEVEVGTAYAELGISFDYRGFHKKLAALCEQLNGVFLLPSESPHLAISEKGQTCEAVFNEQCLNFPKEDVRILPIRNVTLEELAHWFLKEIASDQAFLKASHIRSLHVKVYNGPAHAASATTTVSLD